MKHLNILVVFLSIVYDYRKETRLCTLLRWPVKKKLWRYLFNVVPKLTFSHRCVAYFIAF